MFVVFWHIRLAIDRGLVCCETLGVCWWSGSVTRGAYSWTGTSRCQATWAMGSTGSFGQPRHNWKTLMFIPNVGIPWIGSLIYHSFCYIYICTWKTTITIHKHFFCGLPRSKIDHDVIVEWDKWTNLGNSLYSQNKLPEGSMNILVAKNILGKGWSDRLEHFHTIYI